MEYSEQALAQDTNSQPVTPVAIKSEPCVADNSSSSIPHESTSNSKKNTSGASRIILADLNDDPPESDGDDDDCPAPAPTPLPVDTPRTTTNDATVVQEKSTVVSRDSEITESDCKKSNRSHKSRSRIKGEYSLECVADIDADQQYSGVTTSRDEKVSSLKTGLVHVARKMPKNAHAHFILGLMYQRLGQPQKAVSSYEKAEEILLKGEEVSDRPEFLSSVQMHHAQCLLLGSIADGNPNKELEPEELEEILCKLKESVHEDIRQAAIWNTLGLILLRTCRIDSAITVLSSLLTLAPDYLDAHANLGVAYLRSGNAELSAKCFQDLILKDQNHPAALMNYAMLLLCKHGSVIAGPGANAGEEASRNQLDAANVAQECLLAAVKVDPRAADIWVNLANAYSIGGDHRSAGKCLEKAAKLEPNCMSTRYAVAVHRIKDAERSQDPTEQLSWAGNEMASILREGDSAIIDPHLGWAGLAMVHRAHHEITTAFETGQKDLTEVEELALYTLKQAIEENPDDAVQWHQLGLYCLRTLQFKTSQKYLKAAIGRCKECSYAWSNLGISLQLSEDPSQAEKVYKRALSLATPRQAHAILSNLGNIYRQQKQYERAKAMLSKALELQPGYAPAYNNLGLVFVAEGCWEDARICFDKALKSDPLLDAAKSNMMKTEEPRQRIRYAYALNHEKWSDPRKWNFEAVATEFKTQVNGVRISCTGNEELTVLRPSSLNPVLVIMEDININHAVEVHNRVIVHEVTCRMLKYLGFGEQWSTISGNWFLISQKSLIDRTLIVKRRGWDVIKATRQCSFNPMVMDTMLHCLPSRIGNEEFFIKENGNKMIGGCTLSAIQVISHLKNSIVEYLWDGFYGWASSCGAS